MRVLDLSLQLALSVIAFIREGCQIQVFVGHSMEPILPRLMAQRRVTVGIRG